MRKRVNAIGLRACLAAILLLLATTAAAQLPTTITISDPQGEVAEVLRHGQLLEQQRQWGEALAHYEDAVRRHPHDASLQERFDAARLHYDLERRYADRSFRESVAQLSSQRAQSLYGQILLKIERTTSTFRIGKNWSIEARPTSWWRSASRLLSRKTSRDAIRRAWTFFGAKCPP